jgi:hypothetical protein
MRINSARTGLLAEISNEKELFRRFVNVLGSKLMCIIVHGIYFPI